MIMKHIQKQREISIIKFFNSEYHNSDWKLFFFDEPEIGKEIQVRYFDVPILENVIYKRKGNHDLWRYKTSLSENKQTSMGLKCPKGHDLDLHNGGCYDFDDKLKHLLQTDHLSVIECLLCKRPYFEMDCHDNSYYERLMNEALHKDAIKDKDQVNTPSAGEPITESPITSAKDSNLVEKHQIKCENDLLKLSENKQTSINHDNNVINDDGWIDFDKKKPKINQFIEGATPCFFAKDRGIYIGYDFQNGEHIQLENSSYIKCGYIKWKPADHIADAIKMVEYCKCKLFLHEMDDEPKCKFCGKDRKIEYCECPESLGKATRCSVHHDQYCEHGENCKMERYCAYCENAIDPNKLTISDHKVDKDPAKSCQSEGEHEAEFKIHPCSYDAREYPLGCNATEIRGYCLTHNFWYRCPNDKPSDNLMLNERVAELEVEIASLKDLKNDMRSWVKTDCGCIDKVIEALGIGGVFPYGNIAASMTHKDFNDWRKLMKNKLKELKGK